MKCKVLLWAICLMSLCLEYRASADTILIHNQKEFESLPATVRTALAKGGDITVSLSPGTYYFKENHIRISDVDRPDCSFVIKGNNSTIISAGPDFSGGDRYPDRFTAEENFIGQSLEPVRLYGPTAFASALIEVVDEQKKICRLTAPSSCQIPKGLSGNCYIKVTQWYKTETYPIDRIEGRSIYFTAHNLECIDRNAKKFNVNYDYYVGEMLPRFQLFNVEPEHSVLSSGKRGICVAAGTEKLHRCDNGCFLYVSDCRFKSFKVSDITFAGNSSKADPSLIRFANLQATGCEISGCVFKSIKSHVFHADGVQHISFHDNHIENCLGAGIAFGKNTTGISVSNNSFHNTGLDNKPTFCVQISGDDYMVSDNEFHNFGYSAIAVGLGPSEFEGHHSAGVVRSNTIYYDKDYLDNILDHSLMDSGAIYLTTVHHGAEVCDNYIHDISGAKDNRGIFCDDGARNFNIHDNRIFGIGNSFSIDSRRVDWFEADCGPANVGNVISRNTTDGPIKFEAREGRNDCKMSGNVLKKNASGEYPSVIAENISRSWFQPMFRKE